jgi:hypothetical protein
MDSLALDHETLAAQLAEPAQAEPLTGWHARRALGFGASDVPALLLALGIASPAGTPDYITEKAKPTNRTRGVARLFAEKAGIVAPKKTSAAAEKGTKRERELLTQWQARIARQQWYCDAEELVIASRVQHSDSMLKCAWPLVDRHAPMLTATLDAWAWDSLGGELVVELKCSASERRDIPWHWRAQVMAQLAVTGADYGLLVCGEFWAAWHGNDGPIRCWEVQRNEDEIAVIRDAARRGWEIVNDLKEENRP